MTPAQQWLLDYIQAWADEYGMTLRQFWSEGGLALDEIELDQVLIDVPCEGGLDALLGAWPTMPKLINKHLRDAAKEQQ